MEIVKKDELPENFITPTVIRRALLEICVFGIGKKDGDHDEKNIEETSIYKLAKDIQAQIEKVGKQKERVRVLWYFKEGEDNEETIEEAKQWCVDNAVCKYYVIVQDGKTKVTDTYVKDLLNTIKKFEESQAQMISMQIAYQRPKY